MKKYKVIDGKLYGLVEIRENIIEILEQCSEQDIYNYCIHNPEKREVCRHFIIDNLKDCRKCPHCGDKLTKGYGFARDYFCKLNNDKITSSYVEWEREVNPVPKWCPFRIDKK